MFTYFTWKSNESIIREKKNPAQAELKRMKEDFEDIESILRIRNLKKDRQHNGQTNGDKRTNNDP